MFMGTTCSDGHEGTCVVMIMGNAYGDGRQGTHVVMAMENTCSDGHVCPFIHPFACLNL